MTTRKSKPSRPARSQRGRAGKTILDLLGEDRAKQILDAIARASIAAHDDLDDPRVRAAIMLLTTILEPYVALEPVVAPNPQLCPNCDATSGSKSPFCSELCNQEASLVRYVRRVIVDGRIEDIDVLRDGIGTPMLMVRSGGYPTRARSVPPDVRTFVIDRDGGQCMVCGARGTEIDHLRDSNDPKYLRLTCRNCNGQAMAGSVVQVNDRELIARFRAQSSRLAQRIAAESALRVCDHESWSTKWRSYKKGWPGAEG